MRKNEYLRVLEVLFKHPRREFYIRELAEVADVSPAFSKKISDMLISEKLIKKRRRGNLVLIRGNLDSLVFRHMKITYSLRKILKTNLLEEVQKNLAELESVVLFGSTARGEDDENSDLDILIIGRGKISTTKLEKVLGRNISLIKYTKKKWREKAKEDKAFYQRILIDGIPLHGRLPIVK